MKNFYKKILVPFIIVLLVVSCDDSEGDNEGKFDDNPQTGWVQLVSDTPYEITLDNFDSSSPLRVPVFVNVPVSTTPLNISYELVPVSGANPNTLFSNDGVVTNLAGESAHFFFDELEGGGFDTDDALDNIENIPTVNFDMTEAANITEPMVFDLVLTSTDRSTVGVGIDGSERPTTVRVEICPMLETAVAPLLADSTFFVGDYNLMVTSGNSLFGGPVFADQVITLSEGAGGSLTREFTVVYEPGGATNEMTVSFAFNEDGSITVDDGLSTNIGCTNLLVLGGDPANIFSFDACTVAETNTITLNMLDFQGGSGGCGVGDVTLTVVLTAAE